MQRSPSLPHHPDDLGVKWRRTDLDWLRVIAGLLIFFHAAMPFIPNGIPMIQNDPSSPPLQLFVGFLHEFRLSLLFLVSGVGVCFALRHRGRSDFFRDRAVRLLVPFLFGVLVVVPPMVFLEKRFNGAFTGSLEPLEWSIPSKYRAIVVTMTMESCSPSMTV